MPDTFPEEHVRMIEEKFPKVGKTLRLVTEQVVKPVSEVIMPIGCLYIDGDGYELTWIWKKDQYVLSLDILEDSWEWFYRDRKTNVYDGEEGLDLKDIVDKTRWLLATKVLANPGDISDEEIEWAKKWAKKHSLYEKG